MSAARLGQSSEVGSLSAGGGLSLRAGRGGSRGVAQDAELAANLEQYRTDVNAVLLGSPPPTRRAALRNDFRAIAEAGFEVDKEALATVADDLLEALADDTFTSEEEATIQAAFNALFTDSTVDQALIDQAFDDFVAVADNLNIDATELATLSADREAIAADYARLGIDRSVPSNLDLILSSRRLGHLELGAAIGTRHDLALHGIGADGHLGVALGTFGQLIPSRMINMICREA